jgi:hypothetical protein
MAAWIVHAGVTRQTNQVHAASPHHGLSSTSPPIVAAGSAALPYQFLSPFTVTVELVV